MFDYLEQMEDDIRSYIDDHDLSDKGDTLDEVYESLYDDLWVYDRVTGNASGSYTFNRYVAKEYVLNNCELLKEALQEFCTPA